MTHRARILADRLLAVPAAFVFNGIARVVGAVMRRDHSITPTNVDRIVVAKLIGMGSILQATPLLNALKHQYPAARLTFVTMRSNRAFAERLSGIDELITLDDRSVLAMATTTVATVAALIRQRADLYFDLEVYSAFSSLLALWATTRNRLGFYRHSVAFKNGIYTHLVYFNTRMLVRRLYLQLGRVAGVPPGCSVRTGPIRVDDSDRESLRRILMDVPQWQSNSAYIVVNPNASDLLLERRWPSEYVVEAVTRLVERGNQVALVGSNDEASYVTDLWNRLTPAAQVRVANTAGRLTLGGLLAIIEGAACVLSNDTGPMHIAIALERPTVCLFGPANPEHYGQEAPNVTIHYARVFCSPCLYEADQPPCNGDNVCMKQIKPDAVVDSVVRLMSRGDATSPADKVFDNHRVPSDGPDGQPLGVVVRASIGR